MSRSAIYVTFGQTHRHVINGVVFDKNCVALIYGDREDVFRIFGRRWCFEYSQDEFDRAFGADQTTGSNKLLRYFPRGIVRHESDD